MNAAWRIVSAKCEAGAAIALIEVTGDIDSALGALGIAPVREGEVRLRDLAGIDRGLVMRWSATCAVLTSHGGPFIVRRLVEALGAAGLRQAEERAGEEELMRRYPEARDALEARMLEALAAAASPRVIDLLLDQPRRWKSSREHDPAIDAVLSRLIRPPLVVALGPSNIGKSTLLNALAGRSVALVADQPGTTRDYVGVHLDLDGLVVRYADTPGLREGAEEIEAEAVGLALDLARGADLVLLCGDAWSPPIDTGALGIKPPTLTVALRSDLGRPCFFADAVVSVRQGVGLGPLAERVREVLVPGSALDDPRPWKFWED